MKNEITTKDLMALNELMTFENWVSLKMKNYSTMINDNSLQKVFKTMAKEHYDNHAKLLNYLESNSQVGGLN